MCLVLPPEETVINEHQLLVSAMLKISAVPARQLTQLVGSLISIMDVIPPGRLHIRPIQSEVFESTILILHRFRPHLQVLGKVLRRRNTSIF